MHFYICTQSFKKLSIKKPKVDFNCHKMPYSAKKKVKKYSLEFNVQQRLSDNIKRILYKMLNVLSIRICLVC